MKEFISFTSNIYQFAMEDISDLPAWQPEKILAALKDNPLTIKNLKVKLDKIYMINSYNEREYLPDVIDAHAWIKLVVELDKPEEIFQNQKTLKFFIEEFVFTAIKYMELCRTFKMMEMMIYTQQIMVEGLRLFSKYFNQLQKYPRMTLILKLTFDFQKQFFKVNYTNQYHYLIVPPTKEEVQTINEFSRELKVGDRVDVLKTQHQSKRLCWLPATYKKSSALYTYVRCDHEKANLSIDFNSMQARPYKSMKDQYEWRMNLKVGDKVDYLKDLNSWIRTQIQEIKQIEDSTDQTIKYIEVKVKDDNDYWISITDPKIQKFGSVTQIRPDGRQEQQFFFEDYNDYILDPDMKQRFVTRSQTSKSMLIIDLLNFAYNQLHLFERIAKTVKEKSMKIQVIADLINFILIVHPLFHRKFAVEYLSEFTQSILDYINNSKEGTIRNFSKQRYEAVITSLQQFMKRLVSTAQRKQKTERLQLDLILRFLFSDFLDRKLQAVSLLTNFFKMCRHGIMRKTLKQFIQWINDNKILVNIYNDKSHSQLIAKSSDFLKYYLQAESSIEQLQPLLIWNDAIIKLVNQNFDDLPNQIKVAIVDKIKNRTNVTNPDALSIIKKTPNCEAWFLQNGGECWVEVVRQKTKRKAQIVQVFKQPFSVVNKITKQMYDMYEGSFKTTYFSYLAEIDYLCKVLQNEEIPLSQKLQFISLVSQIAKNISDQAFDMLLKILLNNTLGEQLSAKFQKFFIKIMPKLKITHLKRLIDQKFSKVQQLQNLTEAEYLIFKKCFIEINDSIQQHKLSEHLHNGKRVSSHYYVLRGKIQDLQAIQKYEWIIFHTKNVQISKQSIKNIGNLLVSAEQANPDLADMAEEYKNNLLKIAIKQLYSAHAKEDGPEKMLLQQKYLIILQQIMNQTQTRGVDEVPSVHALFPLQKIPIKLSDNFNSMKTKVFLEVPSNMTLHQFRSQLCKHINAYTKQTRIMVNGKQLNSRYNGHLIHTLDLGGDIVIDKVHQIPRINLVDNQGMLVEKAKIIFKNLFKQYSSFGMMSKKQCLKYHQKCVGQVMSQGESKVDKIFEQFDKDRDGYLTESDFLSFYEISSRTKQHSVWNNLQAFGVRNDLQILDSLPIVYPDRETLARTKLYDNDQFMTILFQLLASPNVKLAEQAWQLAARLPLYEKFNYDIDLSKQYLTRYWLYIVENKKQFNKITKQILSSVLKMSIETVCIGLKVALECESIDVEIIDLIINHLRQASLLQSIDFFHKVILDYALRIFSKFVIKDQKIANHYITNQESFNKLLREGIMSANSLTRQMFCHILSQLIEESVEINFKLFQSLFNLVYRIFDNCDLSTLTMDYFELFSNLLTILKIHNDLMEKLGLNWLTLTQQIIQIYKSHECTETSMTSKPDQVAEGLLKIITKLLNTDTISSIVNLVPFIFQQSLFPEKGRNKLKTSKSRQDAYQLIYEICKFEKEDGQLSGGLEKLFEAGFKEIYKKMSTKKTYQTFSYYYSYNQSRSQLGYAGIRNLGCICYMISMLQQLYMTAPFRNLILMADDGEPECLTKKGTKEIDDNLFHQLKTMFGYLLLTEKQQYNPDEFCFSFKDFEGLPVNTSVQQDAQQFLNIFFDKLETSLKATPFKHIFENVFGGKSCSHMTCSSCGAVKERSQNFYPLSLEIKGFRTIQQSFKKYIQGEVIQDYQCDGCSKKCDVTKRNFLQKTPNYFIIHLQRMCFNYDRLENEKVNSRWEFPHELNVYNYTLSKQKGIPQKNNQFTYKLRGIVVHYGTADFGHYFSYIRESDHQWIQFNDERVRQFDPSDIQIECFGGQHWRRQSQSAYLLVYERQNKSDIVLQFSNEEEKKKILTQFKLLPAIVQQVKQAKNTSESQVSKVESVGQEMSEGKEELVSKDKQEQKQKMVEKQVQKQEQNKQPCKILVHLDMRKINQYIPKNIKDKIDQQNDEFSFTMNLSNNEFAAFIYNILSIDPPQSLKGQYLQLCYECLHLKQSVKVQPHKSVNVSQWASQRFTQLIQGYGWQFLKSFGQNWQTQILSIQKSTRQVTKCLLQCVINDIIKSNNFNSQLEQTGQTSQAKQQKRKVVIKFLQKLSDMMLNQVSKHWSRFADYFELWINLVKESSFVRRYCEEKMIVEKILQFVMEQQYPFPRTGKRSQMSNQYYSAEFQFPLQLMHTLLVNGYELNDIEEKCLRAYAFMDKIICHRFEGSNMIQTLCKGNNVISQKMGFLLLTNCSNVQQSDQVKPIITSIHEYLSIEDQLKQRRIQWIVGFPNYIEHSRDKGFGSYGCIPSTEPAINFVSALGVPPILQQIMKFKKKSPHVSILLVSMILQLEHDGFVNNLDQIPGKMALQKHYMTQIQTFVNGYYQDTQRPYTPKNYCDYGFRAKRLLEQRPNRPMKNPFPRILLGKTIEQVLVKSQTIQQTFEIKQYNIKTYYLPLQSEMASTLTGKNITLIKNNSNFVCANLPKATKSYGHYNFMTTNSSDEQETEECPKDSVFEGTRQGWLLRKIQIINCSGDDMLSVFGVADTNQCNLHVPGSPMSVQIDSKLSQSIVLIKKNLDEDYGQLNIVFNILGMATTSGYMPRQIITEVDQKAEYNKVNNSDDDEDECSSDTFNY